MALLKGRPVRNEAGYVALFVALLASTIFLGMAALGVDTARWYVEIEQVQQTADAAALAGVTYMPNDFERARTAARAVAEQNGYDHDSADVDVEVSVGAKPSELKVTVSSRVDNSFGGAVGLRESWMSRSATADYTAPAPMGSPCNTFGNEPPGTSKGAQPMTTALPPAGSQFANCTQDPVSGSSNPSMSNPKFWAGVEGPETDKLQGDRFQANKCTETSAVNSADKTYGCAAGKNSEYRQQGYYFAIHVEQAAVGQSLDVQVYDPAFVPVTSFCSGGLAAGDLTNTMNDWVADGVNRYGRFRSGGTGSAVVNAATQKFCSGDAFVGSGSTAVTSRATTTTFQMRERTDTLNPDDANALTSCQAKQFAGFTTAPTKNALTKGSSTYNDQLAQVYHQWVSVCSFVPNAVGDYYLQVRTNVALGGSSVANTKSNSPVIYTGNPAADDQNGDLTRGAGVNAFSVRVVPDQPTSRDDVSVSAWERMPILQLAASPAEFNLVRALPNAKGQYLTFDFYDAADNSDGYVTVLPPADAVGDVKAGSGIPGCKGGKNDESPDNYIEMKNVSGQLDCTYRVQGSKTDGQLIHIVIPIPTNYSCNNATLGGCWFKVRLNYGTDIADFTTWSANIGGDPVRLIK